MLATKRSKRTRTIAIGILLKPTAHIKEYRAGKQKMVCQRQLFVKERTNGTNRELAVNNSRLVIELSQSESAIPGNY